MYRIDPTLTGSMSGQFIKGVENYGLVFVRSSAAWAEQKKDGEDGKLGV